MGTPAGVRWRSDRNVIHSINGAWGRGDRLAAVSLRLACMATRLRTVLQLLNSTSPRYKLLSVIGSPVNTEISNRRFPSLIALHFSLEIVDE
jgi:hypothetical protein